MIPKKESNIYPKTKKNLKALLLYYFGEFDLPQEGAVEMLKEKTSLELNQIEFIVRKLSEAWPIIFKSSFTGGETTMNNLLRYGIDGLTESEEEWSFGPNSSARPVIKKFIEFVRTSERLYEKK